MCPICEVIVVSDKGWHQHLLTALHQKQAYLQDKKELCTPVLVEDVQ